jgi:hypothetical protein
MWIGNSRERLDDEREDDISSRDDEIVSLELYISGRGSIEIFGQSGLERETRTVCVIIGVSGNELDAPPSGLKSLCEN